jgi:uncharacterized phage protein (TIGR02218 family)
VKASVPALDAHYAARTTTIATCIHITRRDATVARFTDHARALVVDGERYESAGGYTASAITSSSRLNPDNLELSGAIDSEVFTEADLMAGKWDFAAFRIFEVNWADTSMGRRRLRRGSFGEVRAAGVAFTVELRGMMDALRQNILPLVSARCDARVGDARCGVDLDALSGGRVTTTVSAAPDRRTFTATGLTQASGWFDTGVLVWNTGENAALFAEVRTFTFGGAVVLVEPAAFDIAAGDEFELEVGCDGLLATCRDKFNNVTRRRAFDFVPGVNRLVAGQ